MTTTPPSISLETAQKILGRGPGELDKIKEMLNTTEFYQNAMSKAQMEAKQKAFGENQSQPGQKKEKDDGAAKGKETAPKEG